MIDHCRNSGLLWLLCELTTNETGCKVARLHITCIYSVATHSWCHYTIHSIMYYFIGILGPRDADLATPWARWPPQTAAARNAPD